MRIERALADFAESLKRAFSVPGAAAPEDQLKRPIGSLIEAAASAFGQSARILSEAHLAEHGVRPDLAVYVGGLVCGYVELKAPGRGADPTRLRGEHDKRQWERLAALPNLLYTDGSEWALYRSGERRGELVRLSGDPLRSGQRAIGREDAARLESVLRDFLFWQPIVPHEPRGLAAFLAPLARFLREEVSAALARPDSAVRLLRREWEAFFFPDADDAQFADAYAQTVTYAMLLARLAGATRLEPREAARALDAGNGLLARTLELLGQEEARSELKVGFEILQRSLEALDPHDFMTGRPHIWLYFYEDFLAAYDPKLRKDYGVYYTPREVVELQVRLAAELLETRFGKRLGFADDGVVFLDPAVGTGTYLVAAVEHGLDRVRDLSGEGAVAARAEDMARRLYGFEVLVGPYAVAHLRLRQTLEGAGARLAGRLRIFLADTLESPHAAPPGGLTLTHRVLTREHEDARRVKNEGEILVCLGNPPYDRQQIEHGDTNTRRKGGWVRFGDRIEGGARPETQGEKPILEAFLEPARRAGAGLHLKNLYNDYVYFWRWALWRMFERQNCGGVLTFITAASYLAGPGFVGMREVMRRTFDELWILDLGGDNLGTRKTPNVFAIQVPVAIAIGVRGPKSHPDVPAKVWYARIEGATREEKLAKLEATTRFVDILWQACPAAWHAPFLPESRGHYFDWPALTDLFPWWHSGVQFKRTWPIAPELNVLRRRWGELCSAHPDTRKELFKLSDASRKVDVARFFGNDVIAALTRYAHRSFDRQYCILHRRVADRPRPELSATHGPHQVYLTTLLAFPLGAGPAVVATADIPDLHHFCGRGGKDVMPLWRDPAGTQPNVTRGLLDLLAASYGRTVPAEDLLAYVYALLANRAYTRRFWNELATPGPRVSLSKDPTLFERAVRLGRRLLWLHTFAERFRGEDRGDRVPQGSARCVRGVPTDPDRYPDAFDYDPSSRTLRVGEGRFAPVSPELWGFEVSGLRVVASWLGYRMRTRKGRKSSPLDEIRPERWTPAFTEELLELLWVLEHTLAMEPELEALLDEVVRGPCFTSEELPKPSEEERRPPRRADAAAPLLEPLETDDPGEADEEPE